MGEMTETHAQNAPKTGKKTMMDPKVKERNIQSSILFMQQEHADTLQGLHGEIQRLQKRCSDLTFQLAMETTSTSQEDFFREKAENLEKETKDLLKCKTEYRDNLEKREKKIIVLEQKLKAQEKKFKDEIKLKDQKLRDLNTELDTKANTVVQLTTQLRNLHAFGHSRDFERSSIERRSSIESRSSIERSSFEKREQADGEAHFPNPPKDGSASKHRRRIRQPITVDSSKHPVLNNLVKPRPPSSRRLSTPESPEEKIPDPTPFLQRELSSSRLHKELSRSQIAHSERVPLPPISSKTDENGDPMVPQQTSSYTFSQKTPLHKKKSEKRSSSSSPDVEVLAIDQVGRKHNLRQAQEYNSRD